MSAPAAHGRPPPAPPSRSRSTTSLRTVVAADRVTAVFGRYLLTGDEEALDDVVRATRPRLLAAARRIGNPADAEDSVQTAFLSLIRHRGAPFDAPVMPWLLTAVVRTAYRRKASARREEALAERLALVADASAEDRAAVGDDPDVVRLRAEIARLPDRYRDPVVLHHVQGLSTAETARLLDVPEATVRTRLRRARALVRTRWNPKTAAALLALPWFLADLGRGGSAGAGAGTALAAGGLMQLSTALPLAAVVALGVGALLGRTVLAPAAPAADTARSPADATAKIAALEAKVHALEQELGESKSRLAAAPSRTPTAPTAPAAPADRPAPAAEGTPKADEGKATGARIVIPGFEKATDGVDWPSIGKNLSAMPPIIEKLFVQWEKDGTPSIELAGSLQAHNGPLVMAAGVVSRAMNVKNPNLAFTHPVFQANALVAALEAFGQPLSKAQLATLEALARQGAEEEVARASRYGETTLELTKLLDQAEVRDRFFEGVRGLLTPEQRPVLGGEEYRGRLQADLYSSGLLWATVAQAIPATDRTQLAASFTPLFQRTFGLPDASAAEFGKLVEEWARETPDEFFAAEPDPKDAKGLLRVAYVTEVARRQAALEARVIDRLRLDDATIAKVRAVGILLVPNRVAPTK